MYKFKIEKLNCMSCLYIIEEKLKEFDKTITAQVDIRNQLLTVDTVQPVEKIRKLIEDAGYPVDGFTRG